MEYIQFIRGIDQFKGFIELKGLLLADLGFYEDRHLWLLYHHQDGRKNVLAIERKLNDKEVYFDVIADKVFEPTKVIILDWNAKQTEVENIDEFIVYAKRVAKFICDLDNNRYGKGKQI